MLSTFELRYETPDSTHLGEINIDYISYRILLHINELERTVEFIKIIIVLRKTSSQTFLIILHEANVD